MLCDLSCSQLMSSVSASWEHVSPSVLVKGELTVPFVESNFGLWGVKEHELQLKKGQKCERE